MYRDAAEKHLKRPDENDNWAKLKREDYIEMQFTNTEENGANATPKGKFQVLRVGKGQNVNKYICRRVTGRKSKAKTEYPFDIGYVQRKLFKHFFPIT